MEHKNEKRIQMKNKVVYNTMNILILVIKLISCFSKKAKGKSHASYMGWF